MAAVAHLDHDVQRLRQAHPAFVGPVSGREGFKHIGHADHAGLQGHLLTREPFGVSAPVHALVVPARVFGHVLEVARPGQRLQHPVGGHDVVVDDVALGLGQRARPDGEVLHLVRRQKTGLYALRIAPLALRPHVTHPLLVGRAHRLHPLVHCTQKIAVFVQRRQLLLQRLLDAGLGSSIGHRPQGQLSPQGREFSVALEHLNTRLHQANAVIQRLQLGGLVHHMHGGGDLAAVVQQTRHLELVPVALGHVKTCQRPLLRRMRCFSQHHREGRHALAMPAGVGRLFVNRQVDEVDEVDERFKQPLQLGDEQAVGERDGCLGCQRFGQALVGLREGNDGARLRVARVDELQHTDQLPVVVLHRHRQEGLRAVTRSLVKGPRARKVEALGAVGIGNVHRAVVNGRMGGYQRIIGRAIGRAQGQQRQLHRFARGAAQANAK